MNACKACDKEISSQARSGMCITCYNKWYQTIYRHDPQNRRKKRESESLRRSKDPQGARDKHREWSNKNRPKIKAAQARTRVLPHVRFNQSQHVAKRRGLEWHLTKEQYLSLVSRPCEYCGGMLSGTGSSLDRIDNGRGYEIGNVVQCCGPCNRVKSDVLTYEEMIVGMRAIVCLRNKKKLRVVGEV